MHKIDIDKTLEAIRSMYEEARNIPDQDEVQWACNVDGVEPVIAFSRWFYERRDTMNPNDLAEAMGVLAGQMILGPMGSFEAEDHAGVLETAMNGLLMQFNLFLAGDMDEHDTSVSIVTRDVGDA